MSKRKKSIIVVFFISIILIFRIIFSLVQNGIELSILNNVYKDIDIIEQRIAIYYLNNGNLPTKDKNINFNNSINPNDNNNFYEIDLEKLENLSINYGRKIYGEEDIYIINDQSHTIYYLKGVKYKKDKIYTRTYKYEKVDLEKYK